MFKIKKNSIDAIKAYTFDHNSNNKLFYPILLAS